MKPVWWAGAALCIFAAIASGVVHTAALPALDLAITAWFQAHATPGVTVWVLWLTNANDPIAIGVFGVLFGLCLWRRRERFWLHALAAVLPAGMLINVLLKHLFRRDRPSIDEPVLSLATYSFPSGHVSGAVLFWGLLAAYLAARRPGPHRAWWPWLGAALMVAAVGLSRIYLGVHYFSDVLAAVAWSAAWLVLWLSAASPLRSGRAPGQPG